MIALPFAIPWRVFAAAALAAGIFAAGWATNGWRKDAEIERINSSVAQERQRQALAQVKAVNDARIEEQRRTAAQTEIANAAKKEADGARADADAAGDAADRLRQRVEQLLTAARAAGNTASASAGAPAGAPLGMLADVLERADRRAGILAAYADQAHVAGLACERAYDSLINVGGP
ncbi:MULTISPECIES: DUF2514 family protein [unclassified Cupriavidus]|uniref:DUF2514 family protein n=1 Tax=unclassified Cupriavidus TaxID=2640874 RepID=UPI00313F2788